MRRTSGDGNYPSSPTSHALDSADSQQWVELKVGFWATFLIGLSVYIFAVIMLILGRNNYGMEGPLQLPCCLLNGGSSYASTSRVYRRSGSEGSLGWFQEWPQHGQGQAFVLAGSECYCQRLMGRSICGRVEGCLDGLPCLVGIPGICPSMTLLTVLQIVLVSQWPLCLRKETTNRPMAHSFGFAMAILSAT
jgi:hypothetical protein